MYRACRLSVHRFKFWLLFLNNFNFFTKKKSAPRNPPLNPFGAWVVTWPRFHSGDVWLMAWVANPQRDSEGGYGGQTYFLISKNRSQIFRKWYSAWITSWLDHRGHKKSWEPTMGNLIRPSKNRSDNLQKLWPQIPNNEITQNYDFSTGEHLKITPDTCKDFWNIFARRTQGVSITPRHARARKFY